MKKDPDLKEKLRAAMEQFPDEYTADFFGPEDDVKYTKSPNKFMKELKKFASKNKLKGGKSSLEILREIRSGKNR